MYDQHWARSVYDKYKGLRTRAYQINLCIQQLVVTQDGQKLDISDLENMLVDSIAGRNYKGLWNDYKRLVKRSPLDRALLYTVAQKLSIITPPDSKQLTFGF